MIRVSNKKAVRNIAKKSLKSSRTRNIVAICAIALTAVMFTALFTIGGSMVTSFQQATMQQVGTEAHGGYKFLTQEQYDKVAADKKVKDISYDIFVASAENKQLNKTATEIRYSEPKDAGWSFSTPTTGTLPKKKYDIATDTAVLDALGVPHKLGETVTLTFSSQGKRYTQAFTLCGFWKGSIALGVNEAYVSREYCDQVASVIKTPLYESGSSDYSGTINASLWFSTPWNLDKQMSDLTKRCGFDKRVNEGVNWAYAASTVDSTTMALLIGMLALILLSGYLIIYNVFQISVSRDIRLYGLLKTIGTTGKQLKTIVRRQAFTLCIAGIPIGLAVGYFLGMLLMPAVVKITALSDSLVISTDPVIFIGAALFALLTVLISCIKPCLMAARVSPVEAVRWTGVDIKTKAARHSGFRRKAKAVRPEICSTEAMDDRQSVKIKVKADGKKSRRVSPLSMAWASVRRDRKKAVLVVLSLTLSLVILNGTYLTINGFDMNEYVKNSIVTDFSMTDASITNEMANIKDLNGVSRKTMEKVSELPGLESSGSIWATSSNHKLSAKALSRTKKIVKDNPDKLPSPYADTDISYMKKYGTIFDFIYGIDDSLLDTMEMGENQKLDKEKFATGNYVIASAFCSDGTNPYYKPGDKVTIKFKSGREKTYTVLAIGDIPYAMSQQYSGMLDVHFTLPAKEYNVMTGSTGALSIGFNVDDAHTAEVEKWCENYTKGEGSSLSYKSKGMFEKEFAGLKMTFGLVGGALSLILGLIGILNFANVIITSVAMRKRELAILQSVGMTSRQMIRMLTDEGLIYAALTTLFASTAGSVICWAGVKLLTNQIWFFKWHLTVLPILVCVPLMAVIAVLIPYICGRSTTRHSIIERLGVTE